MKKMKTVCLCLACMLASASISHADYTVLDRESSTEPIGNGVTYTEDLILSDRGHISVRIIEGSLSEDGIGLDVLSGPHVNMRSSLSELASGEPSAIGAINGDFFDTGLSASMGPLVVDGVLLSSSIGDPGFNAAWTDSSGLLGIGGMFEETYTLENLTSRKKIPVSYINKPYLDPERVIVYDSAWEGLPPQKPDTVYMGVSGGRVESFEGTATELDMEALDFIVAARGLAKTELTEAFGERQRVRLDIDTVPSLSDLTDALGGGSLLLEDGEIPDSFSLPISGLHPRTALGTDKAGDRFWLLTVDGRNPSATGMTETELAVYMKKLGVWDAISLDGGGSTEMMARRLGESDLQIANSPSGGTERRISNAIAVTSSQTSLEPFDFKITAKDDKVVLGTSRLLQTRFYDRNFNPARDDSASIEWTATGNGRVENGRFYPGEAGICTVTGTYKGKSHSMKFTCVGGSIGLRLAPRNLSVDLGEETDMAAFINTADGYRIAVDFSDLTVSFPDRLGTLVGNTFTAAGRTSSGKMSASFGDCSDEIPVSVGYSSFVFNDFESEGDTFSSYPAAVTGSYGLDEDISKNGGASGMLTYDFTKTDATRAAYVNLSHKLYSTPSRLGVWVRGDEGGGHWLRASYADSGGNKGTLDFARYVDWTGWRFVEADIPASAVFPIKLERIYLVETDPENKTEGRIWLDDFTAFYKTPYGGQVNSRDMPAPEDTDLIVGRPENPSLSISVLGNTSPVATMLDRLIHIRLAEIAKESDFLLSSGTLDQDLAGRLETPLAVGACCSATRGEGLLILNVDNSSGKGIRPSQPSQIPWLREELENASEKSVLLSLTNSWNFADPLEEDLVLGWLEDYRTRTGGKTYAIVPSGDGEMRMEMKNGLKIIGAPSTPDVNGIDIFTDLNAMTLFMTDDGLKYTVEPIYKRP